jgi:hypothetical protein
MGGVSRKKILLQDFWELQEFRVLGSDAEEATIFSDFKSVLFLIIL